jgi:hypothetical protein
MIHCEQINDDVTMIYINLDRIDPSSFSVPTTMTTRYLYDDLSTILYNNTHDHDHNRISHKRIDITIFGRDCIDKDNNGPHNTITATTTTTTKTPKRRRRRHRHVNVYHSIFHLLSKNEHIHTIILNNATLDPSWFVPLLRQSKGHNQISLVSLHLRHCQLSNDVQHHETIQQQHHPHHAIIEKAFRMNQSIQHLVLHDIDPSLMDTILNAIADHKRICHLDIKAPTDLQHQIRLIQSISRLLRHNDNHSRKKEKEYSLQHIELWKFSFLSISSTDTHYDGILGATTYASMFFSEMMSCKTLRHISLEDCYFDHICTNRIEESIANSTIEIVDIETDCMFMHHSNQMKPKLCVVNSILKYHSTCMIQEININGIHDDDDQHFLELMKTIKEKEEIVQSDHHHHVRCVASLSLGSISSCSYDETTEHDTNDHASQQQHQQSTIDCLIVYIPQFVKLKSISFSYQNYNHENEHRHHSMMTKKLLVAIQQNSSLIAIDIDIPCYDWDDDNNESYDGDTKFEKQVKHYCIRNQQLSNIMLNPYGMKSSLYPYLLHSILLQLSHGSNNQAMNMIYQFLLAVTE